MTVLWLWVGVAVFTVVVLAFCGYELAWKSRRLSKDLSGLAVLQSELVAVTESLTVMQTRLARARTDEEAG